jgi:hypothetical protein
MQNNTILNAAITAIVGALLASIAPLLIQRSKWASNIVATVLMAIGARYAFILELGVDLGFFGLLIALFFFVGDGPVTYQGVRVLIALAIAAVFQFFSIRNSYRRCKRQ